jgi:hypothetical protein
MSRGWRVIGCAAGLLALLVASGGHWTVLQSVAWARMLIEYSRDSSLAEAIEKTFDGEHPCSLCHKIRQGRQQEEQQPPLRPWEKQSEFLLDSRRVAVPLPPATAAEVSAAALNLHSDFIPAPPKPPPRAA